MIFIGDYFAFVLVLLLCIFFFDKKHTLNKTSKYFVGFLLMTAATSAIDVVTGIMNYPKMPLWIGYIVNSLYFIVNILSTSCVAIYLFNKILEHSHDKHCLKYAKRGLTACLIVFLGFIIANIWNGWLFYFDEGGLYCRGPLNALGYYITIIQMILVSICYFRNRKNANKTIRRILISIFPIVGLFIAVQRVYPEIMMNSLIMSMVATVLFATFNAQRPGVHALTRLNDRHRFFDALEMYISSGKPFHIFTINIKNFGLINQKHGHIFGDELLYQFAFSLEKLFKTGEAFHMNGTVFALILPGSEDKPTGKLLSALPVFDHKSITRQRTALLDFLNAGIDCESSHITLDYVVVEYASTAEQNTAGQLYELLEYCAAKAYKNKIHHIFYTPELGAEMRRRRYLIERMQHIDREHGFRTWYQPIRSTSSGEFTSMEALIRLQEPDGSIVSPAEFIPLAEETGMIAPITWFVLEESCRLLRDHPELKNASIAINLPMAQLLDNSFNTRVNCIVDSYGIAHERIGLEFTERAILENFEQVQNVMNRFTQDGYRFYLDDFGAGYSNFNCLLQLPFHNIKLDMNLTRMDITSDGQQQLGLVKTLTGFLRDMDLTVVAEGVETTEAARALEAMGVDRIQGYIYARPMSEESLLEFYRASA